jgi:hypothetical protein
MELAQFAQPRETTITCPDSAIRKFLLQHTPTTESLLMIAQLSLVGTANIAREQLMQLALSVMTLTI